MLTQIPAPKERRKQKRRRAALYALDFSYRPSCEVLEDVRAMLALVTERVAQEERASSHKAKPKPFKPVVGAKKFSPAWPTPDYFELPSLINRTRASQYLLKLNPACRNLEIVNSRLQPSSSPKPPTSRRFYIDQNPVEEDQ